MRFALPLAVLVLAAAPVGAQFAVSPPPLQPDRTPLAATLEVPEGFDLFVTDSVSRALFNPARLAGTNGSFAYASVTPYSGSSYTCSVGGNCYSFYPSGERTHGAFAFQTQRLTWLVTAEYSGAYGRGERAVDLLVTPLDSLRATRTLLNTDDYERARHLASGRLAAAWQAGDTGYALGLFGGYQTVTGTETDAFESTSTDFLSAGPEVGREETRRDDYATVRYRAFALGAEFGVSSPRMDLVGALSYQHLASEYRSSRESTFRSERVFSDADASLTEQQGQQEADGRYTLNGAHIGLFGAFYTGRGPTADAVVVEWAASAGGGPARSSASISSLRQTFRGPVGDLALVAEEADVLEYTSPDLSGTDYRTALALGYVHRREIGGVYVVTGARASGSLAWNDNLVRPMRSPSSPYPFPTPITSPDPSFRDAFGQISGSYGTLALSLPLYGEVPVYRQVRVFGGGTFSYRYEGERIEYDLRSSNVSSSLPSPYDALESDGTFEDAAFRSISDFYLGTRLRTEAGLAAQVAFRGSLSAVSSWMVSLGYHF